MGCLQKIKAADFIAFDEVFLQLTGSDPKLELVQSFEGEDANHVHEAPVYVPQTGELVFADTSVVGWLWALDIETHMVRASPSHVFTTFTVYCLLTFIAADSKDQNQPSAS